MTTTQGDANTPEEAEDTHAANLHKMPLKIIRID